MPAKILVVDDEVHLVKIVQLTLERAGYDVVCAYDGGEALEMARREKPSLVLLDLTLPVIDGLRVCTMLKEEEPTKSIPIIVLSARDLSVERARESVPADLFVEKPFNTIVLLEKIASLLKAAG
jgi:DNA-binding response OmpR family regulator